MKKYALWFAPLLVSTVLCAETVQLKDGTYLSGSITSQTEYTLNLRTSYGPLVLNQREVQAILPDKHRIHLKGGTELVGVILDLDEFNLKLQTDSGIVNIDMPQIISIEVYDYDQSAHTAQARVQQQMAAPAAATATVGLSAAAPSSPSAAPSASGLNFDADIEKVFDTKKPEIVNGQVQTVREISAADLRAQRATQLKEIDTAENQTAHAAQIEQTAQAARSGKLEKIKKAQAKKAKRPNEALATKLFSITVGAQTNSLKLDNSSRTGFAGQDPYEVGGDSIRAETTFMWRLFGTNLWAGPSLALVNIPKNSFPDLDPTVIAGNAYSLSTYGYLDYDPNVSTSGQQIDLQVKTAYYFTPNRLIHLYATAAGGYRFLTLNYRGGAQSDTLHASAPLGAVGLGAQLYADDMLLGVEVMEYANPYSGQYKTSATFNTVVSANFSWKF